MLTVTDPLTGASVVDSGSDLSLAAQINTSYHEHKKTEISGTLYNRLLGSRMFSVIEHSGGVANVLISSKLVCRCLSTLSRCLL